MTIEKTQIFKKILNTLVKRINLTKHVFQKKLSLEENCMSIKEIQIYQILT